MTTTDSRGLLATHDHGSRQPGAGPALAPGPERQESAFAAVRRICGGTLHGGRHHLVFGGAALAIPPARISCTCLHPCGPCPASSPRVPTSLLFPALPHLPGGCS